MDLEEAVAIMIQHRIRRLPVTAGRGPRRHRDDRRPGRARRRPPSGAADHRRGGEGRAARVLLPPARGLTHGADDTRPAAHAAADRGADQADAAPALDVVLAVGERVSRIVEPRGRRVLPAARHARERPAARSSREPRRAAAVGGPLGPPRGDRGVPGRRHAARERDALLPEGPQGDRAATPTSCSRSTSSSGAYLASAVLAAHRRRCCCSGSSSTCSARLGARGGGVPHWFVYLVIGAPVVYAVSRRSVCLRGDRHRGRVRQSGDADPRARRAPTAPTELSDISRRRWSHSRRRARSGWRSCS